MKKGKPIPRFRSPQEEGDFWMRHDTAEFWSAVEDVRDPLDVTPDLRARVRARHETAKLISLRLYPSQIRMAKAVASRKGVPYQALLRDLIAQGLSIVAEKGTTR